MNILEVKGLNKCLGQFQLKDISFNLPAGYIMGYVGQNGAGKTTTIKLILELLKHSEGEILVNGITCAEDPVRYKDMIGFISDENYFPVSFTMKDIERTCIDFYPSFNREKFRDYKNRWKLPDGKKVCEFSKGMKIRLMFSVALARDTKLLILDEATSGLDPVVRTEILDLMQEYIEDGEHSVLFSTHIMSDLEQIADHIFFIDEGQMVFQGYKDELLESYILVKGGLEELSMDKEKSFVGLKKTSLGFEGLIHVDNAGAIPSSCVVEKPTAEQIVVYTIQGLC